MSQSDNAYLFAITLVLVAHLLYFCACPSYPFFKKIVNIPHQAQSDIIFAEHEYLIKSCQCFNEKGRRRQHVWGGITLPVCTGVSRAFKKIKKIKESTNNVTAEHS